MGFFGDAWDWTKEAASDVWDGVTGAADDTFGQDKVTPYEPDRNSFYLGGDPNYAKDRATDLQNQGSAISSWQRGVGFQGQAGQQAQADKYNNTGSKGMARSQALANQYGDQGQQGNAMQQARALGYDAQGSTGAMQGVTRARTQQGQAANITSQANNTSRTFGARSASAAGRSNVTADGQLEGQARGQQLAAAQALGMQANSGAGQANTQGLRNFAAQTGSGPSAAQSQMQQGADNSMASALAMARSGRGNNTQAARQAMFQNAATQQQTNQQLGTLRAQEFDQAQNRQLGALSAESQALQNYRGQDLQALQAQASALGQARQQDQGQGQYNANLALQNRQLNDQTSLAWAQQQQAAAQRGDAAYFQGQQLGNQSIAQGQQYQLGMVGAANQASGLGQQYELGKDQLANQAISQGQQYQLGMGGLANQAAGQGLNYNLGMQGMANQYNLGMQGLANQTLANQLQANMGYEGMKSGNIMGANTANAQFDQQRDAANTGMVVGALGAVAMASDREAKTDVKKDRGYEFGKAMMDASGYGSQFAAGRAFGRALFQSHDDEDAAQARALGLASGQGAYDAAALAGPSVDIPEYELPPLPSSSQPQGGGGMSSGMMGALMSKAGTASDASSKREIARLNGELERAYSALGGTAPRSRYPVPRAPDTGSLDAAHALSANNWEPRGGGSYPPAHASFDRVALDDAYRLRRDEPTFDLRKAEGYSYRYKNASMPGASAGRHYGPMAQDLEKSPVTRSTVSEGPDGVKRVDTGRLALINTAALSEQQRDIQAMKRALATNNSPGYDRDALDAAYEGQGGRVNRPWRELDPLGERYASSSWRQQPGF